jgi:hypothetical protein
MGGRPDVEVFGPFHRSNSLAPACRRPKQPTRLSSPVEAAAARPVLRKAKSAKTPPPRHRNTSTPCSRRARVSTLGLPPTHRVAETSVARIGRHGARPVLGECGEDLSRGAVLARARPPPHPASMTEVARAGVLRWRVIAATRVIRVGQAASGGSWQQARWWADACQPVVQGRSLSGLRTAQMRVIRSSATSNANTVTVKPSS